MIFEKEKKGNEGGRQVCEAIQAIVATDSVPTTAYCFHYYYHSHLCPSSLHCDWSTGWISFWYLKGMIPFFLRSECQWDLKFKDNFMWFVDCLKLFELGRWCWIRPQIELNLVFACSQRPKVNGCFSYKYLIAWNCLKLFELERTAARDDVGLGHKLNWI